MERLEKILEWGGIRRDAIFLVISVAALTVIALMDDTIHDEDYVLKTYNYPILGKVPNLLNTGNKAYGYYSRKQSNSAGSGRKDG